MKRLFILLAILAIAGCERQAETTTSAGKDFMVDKLFTVDGCSVYRFRDGGGPRYFTNCSGSTSWKTSCGKSCSRGMEISGGRSEEKIQ